MSGLFISCQISGSAGRLSAVIKDICQRIDERNFDVSRFSPDISKVMIVPVCWDASPDKRETKYINYKKGYAAVGLYIPEAEFISSDKEKQFLMAVGCIVRSVYIIDERCRKSRRASFDGAGMAAEILKRLGIDRDKLEKDL